MGLGKHAPRILSALTVLLGSLSAAPAFSQTLSVELGGPADTSSTANPLPLTGISPISFGSTGDYVARITSGPTGSTATGATLTVPPPAIITPIVGIPTASDPPTTITVTSDDARCTTDDTTGSATFGTLTCTLDPIPVGGVEDVPFSVNLPVPTLAGTDADGNTTEVIPSGPAACPSDAAGAHLGPVTATVAAAAPATVTQAPPSPTTVSKYADLSADLSGPASANQGQTVTYTATVTNNGPCPAINVFVDTAVSAGLVFESGAGSCTSDDQCSLGDMAPGQSASFTKTYRVDTLRNNLTTSNNPNNITVHSGDDSDPENVIPGTDDPDDSNDSPITTTLVQSGGAGGCSSSGSAAPWIAAVVALVGLALRSRRAA